MVVQLSTGFHIAANIEANGLYLCGAHCGCAHVWDNAKKTLPREIRKGYECRKGQIRDAYQLLSEPRSIDDGICCHIVA
jgi:hypothetical protein